MASSSHIVVMGVSGSGKTTVATALASRLQWPFVDGDELHPPANVAKMSAGVPLTDDDRRPWLAAIRDWLSAQATAGHRAVVTCSALRRSYRDVLRMADGGVVFVHLAADPELIGQRLSKRAGHFMPADLLTSQFRALEPLGDDEDRVVVSVDTAPEQVVDTIVDKLGLSTR